MKVVSNLDENLFLCEVLVDVEYAKEIEITKVQK